MNGNNPSSPSAAGATPRAAVRRAAARPETESQFLARQAAEAQAAIRGTLAETPMLLRGAADVPAWARRYPWWTIGAASIAGFALAAAVGRRRGAGDAPADREPTIAASVASRATTDERGNRRSAVRSAIFTAVGGVLLEALRMVLRNAVTTAFDRKRSL